jgi:hypothetical protein
VTVRSLLSRAAAALVLVVPFSVAQAVPVSFSFTARIDWAGYYDPDTGITTINGVTLLPNEGRGAGDIFAGTFSYDTDAPSHPGIASTPGVQHWYKDTSAFQGAHFSNLDKSVVFSSSNAFPDSNFTTIAVTNSWSHSIYIRPPFDLADDRWKVASFYFSDWFSEGDLRPTAELDSSKFESRYFDLMLGRDHGFTTLSGTVTGLSQVDANPESDGEVPEPAQLTLFLLATLAAGVVGWRRMPR